MNTPTIMAILAIAAAFLVVIVILVMKARVPGPVVRLLEPREGHPYDPGTLLRAEVRLPGAVAANLGKLTAGLYCTSLHADVAPTGAINIHQDVIRLDPATPDLWENDTMVWIVVFTMPPSNADFRGQGVAASLCGADTDPRDLIEGAVLAAGGVGNFRPAIERGWAAHARQTRWSLRAETEIGNFIKTAGVDLGQA